MSNPDTVLNIVDSLRNNDRTLIQYNVLYCCNFSSFAAQLGDEPCIVLNTADHPSHLYDDCPWCSTNYCTVPTCILGPTTLLISHSMFSPDTVLNSVHSWCSPKYIVLSNAYHILNSLDKLCSTLQQQRCQWPNYCSLITAHTLI